MRAPLVTIGVLSVMAVVATRPAAAGEQATAVRRYQNTPSFLINLGELDTDVRDVDLEMYDWFARQWRVCGNFFVRRESDRPVDAGVTFQVQNEGEYPLRAVATDRAGNRQPRGEDADASDIVAVYDVTPPHVDVVSPSAGSISAPGERVSVVWRTREAHPAGEKSAAVELSGDGGRTWVTLASQIDDAGRFEFTAPDEADAAVVRVTVWDRSSNRGDGTSGVFAVRPKPPVAAAAPAAPVAVPSGSAGDRPVTAGPAQATASVPADAVDPDERARARAAYERGSRALAGGAPADAVSQLREAVARDPHLKAAWLDLSVALVRSTNLTGAREVLAAAMKRFGNDPLFPYNLGLVLMRMGKPAEAKVALQRACHLGPDHVESNWVLAGLALDAGDLASARAFWQRVVRSAAPDSDLRQRAQKYLDASR
jgi:Tfp pilus assembly protein PilF